MRNGEMCSVSEIDAESGKAREFKYAEDDCGKIFTDQGNYFDFINPVGSYRKHQITHKVRMYIWKVPICGKRFLDN
jgi:hypothetical protein